MFKLAKPFFITCETPLHAGSGSELGVVDLPIQRERHTDFPKIEGSSLKGSIREAFEEKYDKTNKTKRKDIHLAFGYDSETDDEKEVKEYFKENTQFSGALGFTDARILLFPVKSMKGVFAYITCPKVLEKFEKDFNLCEGIKFTYEKLHIPTGYCAVNISDKDYIAIDGKTVILEEYAFEIKEDVNISPIVEKLVKLTGNQIISKKIVILSNNDFKDFVNLSTEVITRTKIDNATGTVKGTALFNEEYLPTESIMYSLALTTPIFGENKGSFNEKDGKKAAKLVMDFFKEIPEVIQIGANATIGKGLVTIKTL